MWNTRRDFLSVQQFDEIMFIWSEEPNNSRYLINVIKITEMVQTITWIKQWYLQLQEEVMLLCPLPRISVLQQSAWGEETRTWWRTEDGQQLSLFTLSSYPQSFAVWGCLRSLVHRQSFSGVDAVNVSTSVWWRHTWTLTCPQSSCLT